MAVLYQLIVPGADGIRGSEVQETLVTASDMKAGGETAERQKAFAR
jgi:hypothetical protein